MAHPAIAAATTAVNPALPSLGENVVYLMGLSFVLGSLFTILILILLDVMRQKQVAASSGR